MNSYDLNDFNVDQKKLARMKFRIINEEKQNFKTKSKTREDMVELLREILVEETNKKY